MSECEIKKEQKQLLADEIEAMCHLFRLEDGLDAMILGIVVDEEGRIHVDWRATSFERHPCDNFVIGLSKTIGDVVRQMED